MLKRKVKICNKSDNPLPEYKTEFSAGFDIRIQLNKEGKYRGNGLWVINPIDNRISLCPGGRILIPTGLYVAVPDGYEIQARPRSGSAIDYGITILNTPGTIDCFSEDSLIKTTDGDISIKNLKINDVILSVNDNLEIEKDVIVAIIDKGYSDILKIETEDGVLEVTENTLVYTGRGLIKAIELKENDNIFHF